MGTALLEVKNLKKSFNGVEVLHSVNFSAEAGKVTALVGENGAGKSTLMKILMGEYIADGGDIFLDGEKVEFTNTHQALAQGISMIFQEMSPFPELTVAENLFIGREMSSFGFLRRKQQKAAAQKELDKLGISLDIDAKVKSLTISQIQLLEIAKAVSYDSKIVIMDEPTSSLTDAEVAVLFKTIEELKNKNVAIIYISHKLDELFEIADSICVLRDGSVISARPIAEVDRNVMIKEMVGREINQMFPHVEKTIGDVMFKASHLSEKNVFSDVSFEIRRGEILGFAGMVGAGRTEIAETIFGLGSRSGGLIHINGKSVSVKNTGEAIRRHIALVPEDRGRCGLNLGGSVRTNMCMTILHDIGKCRGHIVNPKAEKEKTGLMAGRMNLKMHSQEQAAAYLSGGNQQKIVVGKWLLTAPDLIIMDEPTRGIDVGSKYEIYELMQELAKEGKAILFISSEMQEVIGICDRVLVLKDGKIIDEMMKDEVSQEKIMTSIVNN